MSITLLPTAEYGLASGALLGIPRGGSSGWSSAIDLGGQSGQVRLRWGVEKIANLLFQRNILRLGENKSISDTPPRVNK